MKDIPVCSGEHEHSTTWANAANQMPHDEDFIETAELFHQLCDSTRLKLLWAIMQGEMCVCDIAELINMSAPAISHHLRILRQAGLIKYKRIGKEVHYSIAKNNDSNFIKNMILYAFARGDENEE